MQKTLPMSMFKPPVLYIPQLSFHEIQLNEYMCLLDYRFLS